MTKNIRDLEYMPDIIKKAYSKILSLMIFTDNNYNQLKMAAFYRIINKIKLSQDERIKLLNLIKTKEITLDKILKEIDLDQYLNDQEKNIFRFSLIKDLIIIMNADYIETEDEKNLLKDIQGYFNISNEQLSFFYKEYESDCYFVNNSMNNDQFNFNKAAQKTITTAASLGIPLGAIYYSGNFKGVGFIGTISGLRSLGIKKRTGKHSLIFGIGTSILLGYLTYQSLDYIFNIKKDEKRKLSNLIDKNISALHEDTKLILHKDIEYFTNYIIESQQAHKNDLNDLLKLTNSLKMALETLKNTGAIVL